MYVDENHNCKMLEYGFNMWPVLLIHSGVFLLTYSYLCHCKILFIKKNKVWKKVLTLAIMPSIHHMKLLIFLKFYITYTSVGLFLWQLIVLH